MFLFPLGKKAVKSSKYFSSVKNCNHPYTHGQLKPSHRDAVVLNLKSEMAKNDNRSLCNVSSVSDPDKGKAL